MGINQFVGGLVDPRLALALARQQSGRQQLLDSFILQRGKLCLRTLVRAAERGIVSKDTWIRRKHFRDTCPKGWHG